MKAALLVALLALGACSTVPQAASPVRTDGMAALGQSTRVGALVVTPLSVAEDSRCPINARCIWAGRLVILASIDPSGGGEAYRGRLTLGEPLSIGRATVTMVSAEPGKLAGTPTPAGHYRFVFQSAAAPR